MATCLCDPWGQDKVKVNEYINPPGYAISLDQLSKSGLFPYLTLWTLRAY